MTTVKRPGSHVVLVFVGLLIGQMLIMSLHARQPNTGQTMLQAWAITVAGPFLSTVGGVVSDAVNVWRDYAELQRVQQENQVLREQLARTQLELHQLKEATQASERLEHLVRFQRTLSTDSLVAQVIGRDMSGWFQMIMIDRGRADGVHLNSVVVTPEGIVGRVISLGLTGAQVQLITDERSGAGAVIGVLGESRAVGVVEGKNEALCKMRYVPGREPVKVDEIVYTTGQDGIYPRGFAIGRVLSVEKGSVMVSHDITIEPLARMGNLEEVIVLLGRPDQIELDSSVIAEK